MNIMRSISSVIRFIAIAALVVPLMAMSPSPAQAAAADATGGKRIVVSLREQRLYAYEGSTLVLSTRVNARGTRAGNFRVQNKIPLANSIVRGWRLMNWLGIYYVGRTQNGIHGPELLRGGGMAFNSLGCVVIPSADLSTRLYRWANVGTPVVIRY